MSSQRHFFQKYSGYLKKNWVIVVFCNLFSSKCFKYLVFSNYHALRILWKINQSIVGWGNYVLMDLSFKVVLFSYRRPQDLFIWEISFIIPPISSVPTPSKVDCSLNWPSYICLLHFTKNLLTMIIFIEIYLANVFFFFFIRLRNLDLHKKGRHMSGTGH